MKHTPHLVGAWLCLILLSSCGIQFERGWKDATSRPVTKGSVEGPWVGTWHSVPTGHTGQLRCIVGPRKNDQGDHEFVYRATWAKIFSGTFAATHQARKTNGGWKIEGRHTMPNWVGGVYQYEGRVEGEAFKLDYRSAKDHGSFEMGRPH